jgi:PKD repeat protein
VTFDASDSSDNHVIESYAWDFADETAAGDGVTVEHAFTAAGTYVVTLTVTDESGNSGTDTVTVTVEEPSGNQAPTAVATATPSSAEVGEEVTFNGSASTDSDGTIEDYSWTILSGSTEVATLSGATATYTFTTAGTYTAVLNVTDDGGLWDTASVTVTVADASSENEPPVADAGDDETITVGTEYTFDGSGSSDADGTIVSYVWTFEYDGEEEVLSGASPDFTFELAGTYVVTLTVTDSDGDTDTDTVQITVEEESGAFPLGLVAAGAILALVAVVVVMLLMKRKGGSKGVESVPSEEPPPPQA